MVKYCLIATEGPTDQAVVNKIFREFDYSEFNGDVGSLDKFWEKLIPKYPLGNNLYRRLTFPTIVFNATHSVAIYQGEGSNLKNSLSLLFSSHKPYRTQLHAFGIVTDADNNSSKIIVKDWNDKLGGTFNHFPQDANSINNGNPRIGVYVVPKDRTGVIDTVMTECGPTAFPTIWPEALNYVNRMRDKDSGHWKPFDEHKALTAAVVSILKPGATNTASYKSDSWISKSTLSSVKDLKDLSDFLIALVS